MKLIGGIMIKTEKETITKKEALVILHNYAMDLTKISEQL